VWEHQDATAHAPRVTSIGNHKISLKSLSSYTQRPIFLHSEALILHLEGEKNGCDQSDAFIVLRAERSNISRCREFCREPFAGSAMLCSLPQLILGST
jgi:hypothetical protein